MEPVSHGSVGQNKIKKKQYFMDSMKKYIQNSAGLKKK